MLSLTYLYTIYRVRILYTKIKMMAEDFLKRHFEFFFFACEFFGEVSKFLSRHI